MKDIKELIIKHNYISGIFGVLLYSAVLSSIFLVVSENFLLTLLFFFLISFIVFLTMNKKWFKTVYLGDKYRGIKVIYDFNRFGEKEKLIRYESIRSATYYYHSYNIPHHYLIKSKYEKFRFECSMEEAKIIRNILQKKGVKSTFHSVLDGIKS